MPTAKENKDYQEFLLELLTSAEVVATSVPNPDPKNPRVHESRNIKVLKHSLKTFGQVVPILLEKGSDIIVAGHGTLRCIKELGRTHILIVRRKFESETEREQLRDMMNRAAELAEWDYQLLGNSIRGYQGDVNMSLMGWEQYELGPILAADFKLPPMSELPGDKNSGPDMGRPIMVTKEQRKILDQAIAHIREHENEPDMSEGRSLELISADYLAG